MRKIRPRAWEIMNGLSLSKDLGSVCDQGLGLRVGPGPGLSVWPGWGQSVTRVRAQSGTDLQPDRLQLPPDMGRDWILAPKLELITGL